MVSMKIQIRKLEFIYIFFYQKISQIISLLTYIKYIDNDVCVIFIYFIKSSKKLFSFFFSITFQWKFCKYYKDIRGLSLAKFI